MLSRLRTHIAARDWFAVAVDFVVVVIGVFVGIEAANWNQGRLDRLEERRYYAQIIADLQVDLATLRTAHQRSLRHDRSAERTLAALAAGSPASVSPGRFASDIHHAGFLYLPRPVRRTYDELVGTGNLGLLRSEAAKSAIADYYSSVDANRQWDDLLRQQQSAYWQVTAGVVPRRVLQDAIRGRQPQLSRSEAAAILDRLRARPSAADMLVGMAAHQERVRRDSEAQAEQARALIRRLEPLAK